MSDNASKKSSTANSNSLLDALKYFLHMQKATPEQGGVHAQKLVYAKPDNYELPGARPMMQDPMTGGKKTMSAEGDYIARMANIDPNELNSSAHPLRAPMSEEYEDQLRKHAQEILKRGNDLPRYMPGDNTAISPTGEVTVQQDIGFALPKQKKTKND